MTPMTSPPNPTPTNASPPAAKNPQTAAAPQNNKVVRKRLQRQTRQTPGFYMQFVTRLHFNAYLSRIAFLSIFAMMMQKVNARIVSLLLILVFLQKLGTELWVHAWLHETTNTRL